ncbi:MAG: PEGA domain-containing protein [Sandaracinaceae bacterium]|nr:PEGA domain-containing protein [Sandaracinaceae bacterium]
MRRALPFFLASFTFLSIAHVAPRAAAQEGEARLLFERGNQHLAAGMRARGARRDRELSEALDAYLGVLRLGARTRNVLFNLGLTLQELRREAEAFNYFSQYLREFELSAEERAAGQERVDAMRPRLAVASITSTPPGAEVRVGRRDLPARGTTPLELALPPGPHELLFSRAGYEDARASVNVDVGHTAIVAVELSGEPVAVQFIAPGGGRLLLDGAEIAAGRAVRVAPGPHLVRLELPNEPPVERRFEVPPGGEPMHISLGAGSAAGAARVVVSANVEAQVFLDGMAVGRGDRVELPAPPGEHVVRVEAAGRHTATRSITLAADQTLALDVTMGEEVSAGGLYAARGVTGALAAFSLIGAAVATGAAVDLRGEWDRRIAAQPADGSEARELEDLADRLEVAAIATDVLWSVTAVMGTIAIALLIVDPGTDTPSTIELAAQPLPFGGALALRGRGF